MDSEGSSLRITLKKIDVIARLYCAKDSSDFPGAFLPFFPDFSTAWEEYCSGKWNENLKAGVHANVWWKMVKLLEKKNVKGEDGYVWCDHHCMHARDHISLLAFGILAFLVIFVPTFLMKY